MKNGRPLSAALISLLIAGCVQDPRPAPTADRLPTQLSIGPSPSTPLVRRNLKTQADFDALEDRLVRRMPLTELIAMYTQLSEGANPAEEPSAVLLMQRLALMHLRLGAREGGFKGAFAVADRLRQDAAESPHTHYLMAAITSLLMPPSADGSYRIDSRRLDVASRLAQHWKRLLEVAPDYVGPSGRGAARIRQDLALLERGIAEATPPAPVAASAAPEPSETAAKAPAEPSAPGDDGQAPEVAAPPVEVAAPAAPEPVSSTASADEATAQQDLHRLDQGDTMARRLMCRDRGERPLSPERVTRDVVRWVELRCAIELDDPTRALAWLKALVESGAATQPCRWLARISGGEPAARTGVAGAMEARGLAACPR